ncbi:MAG: hypothetical protein LBL26_03180, partial [Peptococcaceae bacterium]|nr:hypothetical protein [Peptococcaceae bacterium]
MRSKRAKIGKSQRNRFLAKVLVFVFLVAMLPAFEFDATYADAPTMVYTWEALKTVIEDKTTLSIELGANITVPSNHSSFTVGNKTGVLTIDGGATKHKLVFLGDHRLGVGNIRVPDRDNLTSVTLKNMVIHGRDEVGFIHGASFDGEFRFDNIDFTG